MTCAVRTPLKVEEPGLRDAMRQAAGGVCVVTAGIGAERTGLTVISATSLSIDPPTMIVCVNRAGSVMPVIRRYRHFCVNILAAGQQAIADRFSGRDGSRGEGRYAGATWSLLETGALALDGALASIDCVVDEMIERHSHAILIGSVSAIRLGHGEPLLYSQGHYGEFSAA
jgi:flavin reductase (DIM6/NTAB) family NADH-FMN oxidoreductase RutF